MSVDSNLDGTIEMLKYQVVLYASFVTKTKLQGLLVLCRAILIMENGIAVPRKSKYQMQRVMVKTSKHIQVIIEFVHISIFSNIRHIGVYNIYICSGDITY